MTTTGRGARIAELKREIKRVRKEFTEALHDLDEQLDAFEAGLVTEREVDFYGECAGELEDELEELKTELKSLTTAA